MKISNLLWRDMIESGRRWRLWTTLAWFDIVSRYRNTVLGPFWLTISLAVFVLVLGSLYSTLLNQELRGYLQYVALGLILWTFMATVIIDGCRAFIDAEPVLKQIYKPLPVYMLRVVWRNLIILLHNLPVVALLMLVFLMPPTKAAWLALPGLLLLIATSAWAGLVIGIFATRFRDVMPIITSVLQILFFATPVFWKTDMFTGAPRLLIELNPLYHYIELVRAPLMGEVPSALSYLFVIACTLGGWVFAACFYPRYRDRLVYWV